MADNAGTYQLLTLMADNDNVSLVPCQTLPAINGGPSKMSTMCNAMGACDVYTMVATN